MLKAGRGRGLCLGLPQETSGNWGSQKLCQKDFKSHNCQLKKILNLTIVNWYENCCWFEMDFKPLLKTLNFLIDGNSWLWCTSPSVATKIWKCSKLCNHRSASANIYRYLQINNNIYRSISIFTDLPLQSQNPSFQSPRPAWETILKK